MRREAGSGVRDPVQKDFKEDEEALYRGPFFDVVNPFLVPSILLLEIVVVLLETAVIYSLLERRVVKALASSACANLVTGLLSIFYFALTEIIYSTEAPLTIRILVPLAINIIVEAGVLKLFYKTATVRKILQVSTIMNIISYTLLAFFMYPL